MGAEGLQRAVDVIPGHQRRSRSGGGDGGQSSAPSPMGIGPPGPGWKVRMGPWVLDQPHGTLGAGPTSRKEPLFSQRCSLSAALCPQELRLTQRTGPAPGHSGHGGCCLPG